MPDGQNGGTETDKIPTRETSPPASVDDASRIPSPELKLGNLPDQKAIKLRFSRAMQEHLPPCTWIPPLWDELEFSETKGKEFEDNSSDANGFEGETAAEFLAIQEQVTAWKDTADAFPVQAIEDVPNKKSWPHPFADTSHLDEDEFSEAERNEIETQLNGHSALDKLKGIIGPDAPGTARLGRIFEWTLHRVSVLLSNLNVGLKNKEQYEAARENYLNFLRDIDDHEPEKREGKPGKLNPKDIGAPSGYGRSLKWNCIDPVIYHGRIVGTRVVVKWNPHLSSSGVPIYP